MNNFRALGVIHIYADRPSLIMNELQRSKVKYIYIVNINLWLPSALSNKIDSIYELVETLYHICNIISHRWPEACFQTHFTVNT